MTVSDHPSADHHFNDRLARSSISSVSTHRSIYSQNTASPGWASETPPESHAYDSSTPSTVRAAPSGHPLWHVETSEFPRLVPLDQSLPLLDLEVSDSVVDDSPNYVITPQSIPNVSRRSIQPLESSWPARGPPDSLHSGNAALTNPTGEEPKVKRGRGRPRKLPIQEKEPKPKGAKNARSKTGCLTCRRRKKKCDETKPTCINCRKNGKECEGYPDPVPVSKIKGGQKPKREMLTEEEVDAEDEEDDDDDDEAEDDNNDFLTNGLSSVMSEADATRLDQMLQENFNKHASSFFPPWADRTDRFRDILAPLAQNYSGVQHGILCLSAQHMLIGNPGNATLEQRYMFHLDKGVSYQLELGNRSPHSCVVPNPIANDAYTALALIFCLANEVSRAVKFEGIMLEHYKTVAHLAHVCPQKSANHHFQKLLEDFFYHHNLLALVTSLDMGYRNHDFFLPEFVGDEDVSQVGAASGLWVELSNIHAIREHIRTQRNVYHYPNWSGGLEVQSDVQSLEQGLLREPDTVPGTTQHATALLYRASTLIYLYRTVLPSRPHDKISHTVQQGLKYLAQLMQNPETQGRLLMPLFLLGCAAFQSDQRQQIEVAFTKLLEQRANGNIQRAFTIVKTVWQRMDAQSEESWDWEALGDQLGCALLVP
ncbi:hypothetical protein FH972_022951 [Carpinus fangiana]|uniref:Zn(2)-C6 fungal-type domain-containing protein n=1 Tax=Carpinus fangiana TaxID=176857 RepID=A0A5N6KTR2_9ROSI|nr:hypothetical protein FH972_022951 [Carpinus fangiana]